MSLPDRPTSAFCVAVRPEVARRRPTHSDVERTCRAVGPTQFTPPHQTRQDGPVCVVSGVPVWMGPLLRTCSDFRFSVGDSLEFSGIQFTPPKRTWHRQDGFVVSGVEVWISCKAVAWTSADSVAMLSASGFVNDVMYSRLHLCTQE